MRLHLQGLGVVGCLVARWLEQHSVPFTWNDNEDGMRQAWRASTGSIIPTGTRDGSWEAYCDWWRWFDDRRPPVWGIEDYMEPAMFLWSSKHPPHDGKRVGIKAIGRLGRLTLGSHRSLHLNVQQFVTGTQAKFIESRGQPEGETRVLVTHGFAPGRQEHYVWGWSARVQLKLIAEPEPMLGGRVCFYLRNGYVGDYLYPIPKEPGWYYGGSARVVQILPKVLPVREKVERWVERVTPLLAGAAQVVQIAAVHPQGWRPTPDGEQEMLTRVAASDGLPERWYIRAQGSGGIRHWPIVRQALIKSNLLQGV